MSWAQGQAFDRAVRHGWREVPSWSDDVLLWHPRCGWGIRVDAAGRVERV
jgi:hypothetical protein